MSYNYIIKPKARILKYQLIYTKLYKVDFYIILLYIYIIIKGLGRDQFGFTDSPIVIYISKGDSNDENIK